MPMEADPESHESPPRALKPVPHPGFDDPLHEKDHDWKDALNALHGKSVATTTTTTSIADHQHDHHLQNFPFLQEPQDDDQQKEKQGCGGKWRILKIPRVKSTVQLIRRVLGGGTAFGSAARELPEERCPSVVELLPHTDFSDFCGGAELDAGAKKATMEWWLDHQGRQALVDDAQGHLTSLQDVLNSIAHSIHHKQEIDRRERELHQRRCSLYYAS